VNAVFPLGDPLRHHPELIQKRPPEKQAAPKKTPQNVIGRHRLSHAFLNSVLSSPYGSSTFFVIVK
jgi:hypothetical protein